VIVDVDEQFANFGASGAVVCALLGGLVLAVRATPADSISHASTMQAVA
jgi:hypothetical protein